MRGIYLFKYNGDFVPWNKVLHLRKSGLPEKLVEEALSAVANYDPDREKLLLEYDRGRGRARVVKSHK